MANHQSSKGSLWGVLAMVVIVAVIIAVIASGHEPHFGFG